MQMVTCRLDGERCRRIGDCLRKEGIRLDPEANKIFAHNVQSSIDISLKQKADSSLPHRQTHNTLRKMWLLSREEDVPVGQLRALVLSLARPTAEFLNVRARQFIPRLFDTADGDFLTWAKDADAKELIETIRVLIGDGAKLVSRSRGCGKRSKAKPEPVIFGQTRGDDDGVHKGGRPRHDFQDNLVMYLAIDWTNATGAKPSHGRSDHTGFGDLVHCVFQWVDEPSADQALRRYWEAAEECQIASGEWKPDVLFLNWRRVFANPRDMSVRRCMPRKWLRPCLSLTQAFHRAIEGNALLPLSWRTIRQLQELVSDQRPRNSPEEALKRLVGILARQAAREAVASTPAPITEPADG